MSILELLKNDHDEIKSILAELVNNPTNRDQFMQFVNKLNMHNYAEEKSFYIPLEKLTGNMRIIADTSQIEHKLVKDTVDYIELKDFDHQECKVLISFLKTMIEAHIAKEEQNVFPMVQKIFSSNELQQMADNFKEQKNNFDISKTKPHVRVKANNAMEAENVTDLVTENVVLEQEDA